MVKWLNEFLRDRLLLTPRFSGVWLLASGGETVSHVFSWRADIPVRSNLRLILRPVSQPIAPKHVAADRNVRAPHIHRLNGFRTRFGHWSLVILWPLRHWSLIISPL